MLAGQRTLFLNSSIPFFQILDYCLPIREPLASELNPLTFKVVGTVLRPVVNQVISFQEVLVVG